MHYGPFFLHSEIELPELRNFSGSGRIPVSLTLGGVPAFLTGGVAQGNARQFTRDEFLLEIPGTGRFYTRAGQEIRVEPVAGVPVSDLSIYLLGSVFGALCHQNGLLPLHSSAVAAGGGVTAFLGDSGAGKSTLVALLGERGYRIFADDICLLEPGDGGLVAAPLAGWLKLWRQTFAQLGEEPEAQHRTFSGDDKYRKYLEPQKSEPLPVQQFCFLVRAPAAETQPRLQPLKTVEAIARLIATIYPGYMPEVEEVETRLFRQCAEALAEAKAFELVMPWGWDKVESTLDLVEKDLLGRGATKKQ